MVFNSYFFVKLLHLLLFVYWLGADIGVFYSARFVRDSSLSIDARRMALRILGWIDQIPRYCLVLMLPVGYSLANSVGAARLQRNDFAGIWLVGLLWLSLVWAIHHWQGSALGQRLRRIDLVWRWILVPGLLWDAWQGFTGSGHILAPWLAAKFVVYALLIFCGIMIRVRGAALAPAIRDLLANGSTPAREAAVTQGFARTRYFVLTIWCLLVVAAYLGISKPTFGLR
jgi:hypothetical protein